ncbi:hypothetical protein THOG11_120082 [Vibrio harveyi]|nr:hypothetical protein TH15OA1_410084 [Vibrio harveyi]CAH1543786.1 hypothetical protein VHARVF571_560083 [Vibrio harveyi]CAH1548273.1 hypothetical protein THOD03_110082 [Vibrio harveyi]CAH1552543.1 hypothetical protein THOG11_120082 [Vibrio harveyi]CAK6715655.1 hypothetical protein HORM4_660150 [Vibrio harveyi]
MIGTRGQVDEKLPIIERYFSLYLFYFLKSSFFHALRLKLSPYKIRLVT